MLSIEEILKESASPLPKIWEESLSLSLGVFDPEGSLCYANRGMRLLLQLEENPVPTDWFINPTFERLAAAPISPEPIFEGFMTFGDGRQISRSVLGKVYRQKNHLLVAGEYDLMELDRLNREVLDANKEINNLQRKLLKEKATLEHTLDELRRTQEMLIQSEKMNALGQLVAGVAHEINNPIAYVSSNVHSLGDSFADLSQAFSDLDGLIREMNDPGSLDRVEKIREAHDIDFVLEDFEDLRSATLEGLDRVKKIVEDLRNFSRLDESDQKRVDLLENLESVLAIAGPELKKQRIQLDLDVEKGLLLDCYPALLNQVFMNLIINGVQAMEPGGILTIRGHAQEEKFVITVSDTGMGIPEEIRDQIFNPFFTTKPVGQGTGLGLSLAYRIITDKHKGTLTVDSSPDKGAVFTITIPKENP